ncbi:MAG: DUF4846 domain-containing protein [Cytophagaceae bacterium]
MQPRHYNDTNQQNPMSNLTHMIVFLITLLIFSSSGSHRKTPKEASTYHIYAQNTQKDTIRKVNSIPCPENFNRFSPSNNSFGAYLQQYTLQPEGYSVHYYNGDTKQPSFHYAVLQQDIGNKNLQQCADAIMRLRADYWYQQKKYDQIRFTFTNGTPALYSQWRQGYRPTVNGNQVTWSKKTQADSSYASYRSYLETVFTYCGTASLSKELKSILPKDVTIGDVLIQGGHPGHAMIVVDMCIDAKGNKKVMLAQSYMPAQETHIVKNPAQASSPWFDINVSTIYTSEWTFTSDQWKRFP